MDLTDRSAHALLCALEEFVEVLMDQEDYGSRWRGTEDLSMLRGIQDELRGRLGRP